MLLGDIRSASTQSQLRSRVRCGGAPPCAVIGVAASEADGSYATKTKSLSPIVATSCSVTLSPP